VSSSTTEASISGHLHINLSFLETGYFHSCRSQGVLTAQPYSSSHQDAMIDAEQSVLGGTFHPRRGHFALRVECPGGTFYTGGHCTLRHRFQPPLALGSNYAASTLACVRSGMILKRVDIGGGATTAERTLLLKWDFFTNCTST